MSSVTLTRPFPKSLVECTLFCSIFLQVIRTMKWMLRLVLYAKLNRFLERVHTKIADIFGEKQRSYQFYTSQCTSLVEWLELRCFQDTLEKPLLLFCGCMKVSKKYIQYLDLTISIVIHLRGQKKNLYRDIKEKFISNRVHFSFGIFFKIRKKFWNGKFNILYENQ